MSVTDYKKYRKASRRQHINSVVFLVVYYGTQKKSLLLLAVPPTAISNLILNNRVSNIKLKKTDVHFISYLIEEINKNKYNTFYSNEM